MRLNIQSSKVFEKNYLSTKKIVINRGGTRSGKTYSICQMLAVWLVTGRIRKNQYIKQGKASVVRKHRVTTRGTVEVDFQEILAQLGVYGFVDHNKTRSRYSFSGRSVEFIGADDEQKIRGYKSNILFANEANELHPKKEWFQLLIRTTDLIFLDFNPSDPYTWIRTELEDKRASTKGDVETIVSTYRDNPFLPDSQVEEIKYLQHLDPELWRVYGLGEYGKVEGLIYPDFEIIEEMPPVSELQFLRAGLDFGYTNSATALIYAGFQEPDRLYIDEGLYKHGLHDRLLLQELKAIAHPKTMHVSADSAQAGTIAELQAKGYNVHPVKKVGSGTVNSRVFMTSLVKNCKLFVTGRSQNVIRELKTYKYQQTPQGDWLNEPQKVNDHAMDAIGYFALTNLRSRAPRKGRRTAGTN